MWSRVVSRFLVNINRNLILVEFGKILRLVKLGRLFRYRADVSRNFRLVDSGRFLDFSLGFK